MSDKTIQIRIDLKGRIREMFEEIKEKYGLESHTETIRMIISLAYYHEFEEKKDK